MRFQWWEKLREVVRPAPVVAKTLPDLRNTDWRTTAVVLGIPGCAVPCEELSLREWRALRDCLDWDPPFEKPSHPGLERLSALASSIVRHLESEEVTQ